MIALHGAYYANNFGDLLLLKIFENWIKTASASEVVYPLVPEREQKRFKAHFPQAIMGLEQRKSWQALVFGGGGHFGQPDADLKNVFGNWNKRFLKRHAYPVEMCLWSGTPYAILGVGSGPLSNFFIRQEVKRIFSQAAVLSVRDIQSKKFVEETLGIRSKVKLIPDAALTLTTADIPIKAWEFVNHLLEPYSDSLLLGIHHPRDLIAETPQAESFRKALFNALSADKEVMPIIFADNGTSEYSESCDCLAKMIKNVTGKSSLSVPFSGVWETVALISKLSAVLTTKLHIGIVAYTFGVYAESFAIHSKTPRFYRQIGRPNQCSMLRETTEEISTEKIERALHFAHSQESIKDGNWQKIKEEASLNQKLLYSFLTSL